MFSELRLHFCATENRRVDVLDLFHQALFGKGLFCEAACSLSHAQAALRLGIEDVLVIVQCVALASLAAAAVILLAQTRPRLSISVLILNSILLLLLVGGRNAP